MFKLLRNLVPLSRAGLLLWAWRNRATVMDWAGFGLRATQATAEGKGLDDAKAEFRLRSKLARDARTRSALIEVKVERGVAILRGRVSPEVHAVIQDAAVATPGIRRLDDRLTHTAGRGGLLKRKARVAG